MYNLFSFIVQLRLFLAQFVQFCTQGARPPSAPALARLHRNRGGVLGQNCFFIYLCTAASDPAAKAAVPAMVQIASSGGSSRKLASAPA